MRRAVEIRESFHAWPAAMTAQVHPAIGRLDEATATQRIDAAGRGRCGARGEPACLPAR
jgi:hypothetical protein